MRSTNSATSSGCVNERHADDLRDRGPVGGSLASDDHLLEQVADGSARVAQ